MAFRPDGFRYRLLRWFTNRLSARRMTERDASAGVSARRDPTVRGRYGRHWATDVAESRLDAP